MATELAKAYVQIVPSTKGVGEQLEQQLGGEMSNTGGSLGGKLGAAIKGAIVAAGIGEAIKSALDEGAALQQSIGGIETLFKDSADQVREYANQAYESAGLSANEYMEQVTSFSASLLQSLGGDTQATAEAANNAIIAMADNANKMGTDMQSIQNAYQGFAKQNYTMLDNLKLGYGGTKQEMERLLADAEKLTGIHYDINNLSDVYSAISAIQDNLGITGTTAEEAASTFTGSFAAMKSSVKNLLGSLTLGEDITPALEGLIESVKTFLGNNLLPMVKNLIMGLLNNLPEIAKGGVEMVVGIINAIANDIDEIIPAVVNAVMGVIDALTEPETLEKLLEGLLKLVGGLIAGIIKALPGLCEGLFKAIANILELIGEQIAEFFKPAVNWGKDLIDNFVSGIKERIQHVIDTIKDLAQSIRDLLGFSEPELGPLSDFHTFAPDMMELFARGIRENANLVTDEIENAFDVGPQIVGYAEGSARNYSSVQPAKNTTREWGAGSGGAAISQPQTLNATLVLDGYVLGHVVTPLVNRQNYATGAVL